ncbi:MAG: DMT family transporter [Verrucomicrobia subdivision 3 bacterium]|nr:DMT family transporter [Limisphaerales bacterium]
MQISTTTRTALAALFTGAIAIGFAPILVRFSEVGPSATAAYRVLFALPILGLWMRAEQADIACLPTEQSRVRKDLSWLILAGLFFTGDLAIWHWSLQFTTVANSTLLTNIAPVFVAIGAWLFLDETIKPLFVLALALSLGGAALLASARIELSPGHLRGDLLAILAALFYAGYLLTIKQLRRRFGSAIIMTVSGIVSCACFFIVAALSRETIWPTSPRAWLVVAGLGLVCHLGGQAFITYALGHLPASFSSVSLLVQPFVAAVLAWVLLKERLTLWQWVGGIVVLLGIFLAGRRIGWNAAAETKKEIKQAQL